LGFKDRAGSLTDANYANLTETDAAAPPVGVTENTPRPEEPDFTDISGHWAYKEIKETSRKGYVNGDGDGAFRPDGTVTRAEALKMVMSAAGLPAAVYKGGFDDVSENDWYAPYAAGALAADIFVPGGAFNPNVLLNREETAYLIIKLLKILPNGAPKFPDAGDISAQYSEYVAAAARLGLMAGGDEGLFNPKSAVTRAEMTVILLRVTGLGR
jgi:hypothetical protein